MLQILAILFTVPAGRKKKEQPDANQAGMGMNPAYAGAYGAAPPVSIFPLFQTPRIVFFFFDIYFLTGFLYYIC